MNPVSLANLQPLEAVPHDGLESVPVRVYLTSAEARTWRRLSVMERGDVVRLGLKVRDEGVQFTRTSELDSY